jgi:UDP-3-O-[3-hydroxymyristoyl] glucosamine N-acyltransferase
MGRRDKAVSYVSNLDNADKNCLTFCDQNHINQVPENNAGIILYPMEAKEKITDFKAGSLVLTDDPLFTFTIQLNKNGYNNVLKGNSSSSFDGVTQNLQQVYIESDVQLGTNLEIFPFTSLFSGTRIGKNCRIQSGSSVGAIGLAYTKKDNKYYRIPHLGGVAIGHNVDIGANVTIIRGILQNTIIGHGTKIGNNVNIGHNVVIGKDCFISAGTVISGSVVLEDNCWIAPNVSILNGITIKRCTQVGIGAVVYKNTCKDTVYIGNPAAPVWNRKKRQ